MRSHWTDVWNRHFSNTGKRCMRGTCCRLNRVLAVDCGRKRSRPFLVELRGWSIFFVDLVRDVAERRIFFVAGELHCLGLSVDWGCKTTGRRRPLLSVFPLKSRDWIIGCACPRGQPRSFSDRGLMSNSDCVDSAYCRSLLRLWAFYSLQSGVPQLRNLCSTLTLSRNIGSRGRLPSKLTRTVFTLEIVFSLLNKYK